MCYPSGYWLPARTLQKLDNYPSLICTNQNNAPQQFIPIPIKVVKGSLPPAACSTRNTLATSLMSVHPQLLVPQPITFRLPLPTLIPKEKTKQKSQVQRKSPAKKSKKEEVNLTTIQDNSQVHAYFPLTLARWPIASEHCRWTSDFLSYWPRLASGISKIAGK